MAAQATAAGSGVRRSVRLREKARHATVPPAPAAAPAAAAKKKQARSSSSGAAGAPAAKRKRLPMPDTDESKHTQTQLDLDLEMEMDSDGGAGSGGSDADDADGEFSDFRGASKWANVVTRRKSEHAGSGLGSSAMSGGARQSRVSAAASSGSGRRTSVRDVDESVGPAGLRRHSMAV